MGHLPKIIAIVQVLLTPFHLDFGTESDMIGSLPQTFSVLSNEMLRLEKCNQFGGDRCCIARSLRTKRN